jgi:long-chain acyl-CoA synthetase
MTREKDIITPDRAATLPALFKERVRRTPDACAFRRFDSQGRCCECTTWREAATLAGRWQAALRREGLQPGDRVAVMLHNSLEWVTFDQAALGLGLVTVPLFVNDRPDNFAYIIEETGARLLLIEGVSQWEGIRVVHHRLGGLVRIVSVTRACEEDCDPRLVELGIWLPEHAEDFDDCATDSDRIASIVYTSGTTGNPKGVMLTHANILANTFAGLSIVTIYPDDLFLSFLPLSHILERTVGYYLSIMAGACVAHVRSLAQLPEDLRAVRPTVIVSVPRVFERIHKRILANLAEGPAWKRLLFRLAVSVGWLRFLHSQGRGRWAPLQLLWPVLQQLVAKKILAALGGRVRVAISGGAPLSPEIAREFISLGLPILQGYGLTETSPVVSVNTLEDNRPETVGRPLPGVEVKLSDNSELLVRGPNVMAGYWHNPSATESAINPEGWFHTGDRAAIDDAGHITITGRLKDIIVLSNGEKIPPADIEQAIAADHLFEQVMVVGEGKPYLSALVMVNYTEWDRLIQKLSAGSRGGIPRNCSVVEQELLARIADRMDHFPGYAQIRRVHVTHGEWTVADGLLTPTLKLRRHRIVSLFAREIDQLYEGH